MKLLNRYLFITLFKNFTLVFLFFIFMLIFFRYLDELKNIDSELYTHFPALIFIFFESFASFNELVGISALISIAITVANLSSNRELQIYLCGAISIKKIGLLVLKYGFLISLFLILFFELSFPNMVKFAGNYKSSKIGYSIVANESKNVWLKSNNSFFHFDSVINGSINDIVVFEFGEESSKVYRAREANIEKGNLSASNVDSLNFISNGSKLDVKTDKSSQKSFNIPISQDQLEKLRGDVRYMTFSELFSNLYISNNNIVNKSEISIELYERLFYPLFIFSLLLVSIPYMFSFERDKSTSKKVIVSTSIGLFSNLFTKIFSVMALKIASAIPLIIISPSLMLLFIGYFAFKKLN